MISITYLLSENFRHDNFIIFTDNHKCISAPMKIFSMLVFFHQFFVFTLIFIYCLVCLWGRVIDTIALRKYIPYNVALLYVRFYWQKPTKSVRWIIIRSLICLILRPYYSNSRQKRSTLPLYLRVLISYLYN